MIDPGGAPSQARRRRILIVVLYLVLSLLLLGPIGSRAWVSEYNIACLQLAGSAERAREVRSAVSDDVTVSAIRWDFLFIVCYATALIVGASYFPPRAPRVNPHRIGIWVVGATTAAAVLDIVENVAMLRGLHSSADIAWQVAAVAASVKFVLLGASFVYVVIAIIAYIRAPSGPD